jgi:hypothetical protein
VVGIVPPVQFDVTVRVGRPVMVFDSVAVRPAQSHVKLVVTVRLL